MRNDESFLKFEEQQAIIISIPKENSRQQIVAHENEDGGRDDGVGGGGADALSAAFGIEAVVATHQRDVQVEHSGVTQTLSHIAGFKIMPGLRDVIAGVELQPIDAHQKAAENADDIGNRDE